MKRSLLLPVPSESLILDPQTGPVSGFCDEFRRLWPCTQFEEIARCFFPDCGLELRIPASPDQSYRITMFCDLRPESWRIVSSGEKDPLQREAVQPCDAPNPEQTFIGNGIDQRIFNFEHVRIGSNPDPVLIHHLKRPAVKKQKRRMKKTCTRSKRKNDPIFFRVKDFVLVAVQRRDAGRAEHETQNTLPYPLFPAAPDHSPFPATFPSSS